MNISLISSGVWPINDGLKIVVHNLATALANRGHNVVIVGPYSDVRISDISKNYDVECFGFRGATRMQLTSLLAVYTLIRVVKKFAIDVINVHDVYAPGTWARYFKKIRNDIPIIGTPHGEDIQKFSKLKYGRRLDQKSDKVIRRNVNCFTLLTAISQSVHNELTEILGNDKRIRNIPNGIWTSQFELNVDRLATRKKYRIPIDSTALISVGRNVPKKGFEIGLRAFARLVNAGHRITYILVGRDMYDLVKKAKELNISQFLITPGQINHHDINALYQASDIYVNPSYIESFGLTTLEAMCSALPCVVTDVPGNKDLISSDYGLIVPPGSVDAIFEAIRSLIINNTFKNKLGKAAQIAARRFDWHNVSATYTDVYTQAIKAMSSKL